MKTRDRFGVSLIASYAAPPPPPPPPTYAPAAEKKEGIFGLLGGIFMILGAIGFIGYGAFWAFVGAAIAGFGGWFGVAPFGVAPLTCGIIAIVLGVIELVAAIFAIKRTNWGFALVGAILGLNILGIIFVAVGKKEFQ